MRSWSSVVASKPLNKLVIVMRFCAAYLVQTSLCGFTPTNPSSLDLYETSAATFWSGFGMRRAVTPQHACDELTPL